MSSAACSLKVGDSQEDAGKLLAGFHICPSAEAHEPACRSNNGFCFSSAFQILHKSLSWVKSNPEPCWHRFGKMLLPRIQRKAEEGEMVLSFHQTIWHPSLKFQHTLIKNNFPQFIFLVIYKISPCPVSHSVTPYEAYPHKLLPSFLSF